MSWHELAASRGPAVHGLEYRLPTDARNMLVAGRPSLSAEVVGFRQPLASEHDHIFKAGASG